MTGSPATQTKPQDQKQEAKPGQKEEGSCSTDKAKSEGSCGTGAMKDKSSGGCG